MMIVSPRRLTSALHRYAVVGVTLLSAVSGWGSEQGHVPQFRRDVMPVLFRAGCNAGTCHGAARGKDGFMLSLFGYDPKGDYQRLVEETPGRRVNVAMPDDSLLLLKATGAVPHSGGKLFDRDSDLYRTLRDWIAAGAADDVGEVPEVVGISLPRQSVVFKKIGGRGVARVTATYGDGTSRDVTALARFFSNNPSVATIGPDGDVTAVGPGETHVFARYSRFTVGAEVVVLPADEGFVWSDPPVANVLDEKVYARLKLLRINPSPPCDDATFLRRVTLDLAGRVPTPEEFHAFTADRTADKRARLIDGLLASPAFTDLWTTLWAEWLRLMGGGYAPQGTDIKAAEAFRDWIRKQVAADRPLNEFVAEMTAASGSNLTDGPVNLYTMLVHEVQYTPKQFAADYSQLFLGVQIQCAECHNHPFDRWTMDDYYGFVSCFTGIRRKRGSEVREFIIYSDPAPAPAKHLLDDRPMAARALGDLEPAAAGVDPRESLARWIASPGNRLFARNIANRIWSQLLGRGVIDPVDDVRVSNPPVNEPLLEALAERLTQSGYSLRSLVRDICNSRTYQASLEPNPSNARDTRQFSHARLRRLRADVLLDAIHDVSGRRTDLQGFAEGTRAIEHYPRTPGPTSGGSVGGVPFFAKFGRSSRASVCACETKSDPTLAQTLHLIGYTDLVRDPTSGRGVITKLIESKLPPQDVVEALTIRVLCRRPTEAELARWAKLAEQKGPALAVYEDVFWSLLNSTEFMFNH